MYHSIFIYSGSLFHTGSYHNTGTQLSNASVDGILPTWWRRYGVGVNSLRSGTSGGVVCRFWEVL